jgi:hypothetical protein
MFDSLKMMGASDYLEGYLGEITVSRVFEAERSISS